MGVMMVERLLAYWVYGGALAGIAILCLMPALCADWPAALTAVFAMLPLYMLHQYEEHDDDRFRRFFNETIGHGREVLTPLAVFVVNVPGVWGVVIAAFYLARYIDIGYGLVAVYLVLVNALVHIAHAVLFRRYNPGLATAIVLFLPAGICVLRLIDAAGGGRASMHALGLGIAIAIHAAIIVYAKRRGAFAPAV